MMDSAFSVGDLNEAGVGGIAAPAPYAFAYFVDPAEMVLLVEGWPSDMRLVLCLDSGGLCEFLVFHDDEEREIFDRVAEVFDRPVGAFAVSPEVEGFPTRSLLFSEENALLRAVQESEGLQEIASDYLINYNFALEEGLDPDKFLRSGARPDDELALRATTEKIFPMRSKASSHKRKFRSRTPEGYVPVDVVASDECFYLPLDMWRVGDRIRIASASDAHFEIVPTLVREIAFRDDFSSVYIPRKLLPEQWRPQDGLVFEIPVELFPSGFAENCGHRKVRLAVMPRGVFVEFGGAVTPPQPGAPLAGASSPVPPLGLRKRFLKTIYLPLIAMAVLGATGLFSAIGAQTAGTTGATPAQAAVKAVPEMPR